MSKPTAGPRRSARFDTITGEAWVRSLRAARERRPVKVQALKNHIEKLGGFTTCSMMGN